MKHWCVVLALVLTAVGWSVAGCNSSNKTASTEVDQRIVAANGYQQGIFDEQLPVDLGEWVVSVEIVRLTPFNFELNLTDKVGDVYNLNVGLRTDGNGLLRILKPVNPSVEKIENITRYREQIKFRQDLITS